MAKSVEKIYGKALFDVAVESGKMDKMLDDGQDLVVIFSENEELLNLLKNPQVTFAEKEDVLVNIFKDKIESEMLETLNILVKNGRQKNIIGTFNYFISLCKIEKNIGVVFVTSANELEAANKERIENKLLETTKYDSLEMHYIVDKTILGGLIIRVNDRVVDSSLKTKLNELSRELTKVSLESKMKD